MAVAAPPAPKISMAAALPPVIATVQPAFASPGPAVAVPGRSLSLLALGSLLLSLATLPLNPLSSKYGWPVGLLGCVPGVILGHMALTELGLDRRKMGAPLAWIGLIFGYLCLVVGLVAWCIYGYKRFVKHEGPLQARNSPFAEPGSRIPTTLNTPANPNSRSPVASPNQSAPARVTPRVVDPKLTTNPLTAEIPEAPVAGTVLGDNFKLDAAAITAQGLELKQGAGFSPDASVMLFLFARGQLLDGRKFIVAPSDSAGTNPHVHLRRKEGSKSNVAMSNYALRLEFGQRQGNKLPGKIFLEMPRSMETKFAGTFEATISR